MSSSREARDPPPGRSVANAHDGELSDKSSRGGDRQAAVGEGESLVPSSGDDPDGTSDEHHAAGALTPKEKGGATPDGISEPDVRYIPTQVPVGSETPAQQSSLSPQVCATVLPGTSALGGDAIGPSPHAQGRIGGTGRGTTSLSWGEQGLIPPKAGSLLTNRGESNVPRIAISTEQCHQGAFVSAKGAAGHKYSDHATDAEAVPVKSTRDTILAAAELQAGGRPRLSGDPGQADDRPGHRHRVGSELPSV